MEDIETGEQKPVWGEHPNGCLVLTPGGRWIVVQTAEGREAPQSGDDQAAAFRSMLAYSGKYSVDRSTIAIKVDIAWDESWVGTEQIRTAGSKATASSSRPLPSHMPTSAVV
jgi:hypothetical protein